MSEERFDYKEYAQSLAAQASELLPNDISEDEKSYVLDKIYENYILSANALTNDETKYNDEQISLISQIVAEWTFYKSMDIIYSKIPSDLWDSIIQKVCYVTFDIAKQTTDGKYNQDIIAGCVEKSINKHFKEHITDLYNQNLISEDCLLEIIQHSHIDYRRGLDKLENSFNTQDKKWIKKDIKVYIEPINVLNIINNKIYYNFAVNAVNMWTKAISDFMNIKYTKDIMESDINIRWKLSEKTNTACTLSWTDDYKIYSADITIELSQTESIQTIKALVLHSIGHALGLVHSENKHSVMSESYIAQSISDDDIKQIEYLYK